MHPEFTIDFGGVVSHIAESIDTAYVHNSQIKMKPTTASFIEAFGCKYYPSVTADDSSPMQPSDDRIIHDRVAKHLSGEIRMGLVTPSVTGRSYWAVITIDESSLPTHDERWAAVQKVKYALSEHGVTALVERGKSLGSEDYQIWTFFSAPHEASQVYDVLHGLVIELDLDYFATIVPTTSKEYGHAVQTIWLPLYGGQEDTIGRQRGGGVATDRTVFVADDQSVLASQGKVLKTSTQVPNSCFEAMEIATMPHQSAWQDAKAGYCAGPDELQLVLDNCPFVKWCEEQDGVLSKPLREALISNLCRFGESGVKKVCDILKLDEYKPFANPDGREVQRRIMKLWNTAGPLSYAAIKKLGWPFFMPTWPGSPAGWGLYLDLDRLIKDFSALKASPQRLERALTEHFRQDYFRLPGDTQVIWLKRLSSEIGIPIEELAKRAVDAFDKIELSGWDLGKLLALSKRFRYTPERQGSLMYRWLIANGGKVFSDPHDVYYLVFQGQEAEVGKGKVFDAFLFETTRTTLATPNINRVIKAFQAEAYRKALRVDQLTWNQTHAATFTVYLHLNSIGKGIIKLSPRTVEEIPNAINEQDIFLARSPKMHEWELLQLSDVEYKDGLRRFDKLVMQNMACTRADQLLYGCWALCYPLIGFVTSRPHLRAEGTSGSGKTRAMDLVGHFVYGTQQLKTPTEAANISDAAMNPLVLLDNVESENLSGGLRNFILWAVSGTKKEKRKAGTASKIIAEPLNCLVNTTGIENLSKTELINRTIHIEFDKLLQRKSGLPTTVYDEIRNERSILVTAHLMLASRILARIANGDWKSRVSQIAKDHPKFILDRSNEYLALMALTADELLPIISPKTKAGTLLATWVKTQTKYVAATSSGSNPIVGLVNAIFADKVRNDALLKPRKWPYELLCDGRTIHGSAGEFHRTFLEVKSQHSLAYDYKNESTLSRRLNDSIDALNSVGYEVTRKQDGHRKHLVFTITKKKRRAAK